MGTKAKKGDKRLGNQFWLARSSHGAKPKFETPEQLWEACCEYFQWVEDNPLWEEKGFAFQGVVTKERFSKMRAMTLSSLTIFLDVEQHTWSNWRESRKDLLPVINLVDEIIRNQKFSGAAADLLNANIIARDLGLRDKQEHEHKGEALSPQINVTVASPKS